MPPGKKPPNKNTIRKKKPPGKMPPFLNFNFLACLLTCVRSGENYELRKAKYFSSHVSTRKIFDFIHFLPWLISTNVTYLKLVVKLVVRHAVTYFHFSGLRNYCTKIHMTCNLYISYKDS